ncbi:MAG: DNA methyltransferase [Campylobacterota bacterium]|nr:DNA methyltransferase [Campylobacterota bacterium]
MQKELRLKLEYVAIDSIVPYVSNTRIHSSEQIEQIKASIVEFGMCTPIGIHNNTIVYGHGRYESLKQLDYDEIPIIDLSHLTDAQRRGLIIADNKIGDNSEFDEDLLKIEIEGLMDDDFNIDLLGFDMDELDDLGIDFDDDSLVLDEDKADEVPELVDEPCIKRGDLIELGMNFQHRVLCENSSNEDVVGDLMNGSEVDLVITDPPYLLETKGGCNGSIGKGLEKQGNNIEFISDFNPMQFLETLPKVFKKNIVNAYVFCNKELLPDYLMWAKENKISFNPLIWKKPNAIPIGGSHRPDIEFLLLFRKSATWNGNLKDVSYLRVIEEKRDSGLHPTMKPVSILENQMLISSNVNDIVMDFFGGSGSTMIACENLNRQCRMIELSEQYAQVIIQRYCDYTSIDTIKINGKEVSWSQYKEDNTK